MFNLFENTTNDFDYLLNSIGQEVIISNILTRAVITNTKLNIFVDFDDRHIATQTPIKRGDIVEWQDKTWFIFSEIATKRHSKYKGIMRKANHTIKFIINREIHEFPTIVQSKTFDEQGGIVSLSTGKVLVTLQDNEQTKKIVNGQRFINTGQAFKIVGIDKSKVGFITFTADLDTFKTSDNKDLEIAEYWDNIDVFSIEANDTVTLNVGATHQIEYTTLKNRNVFSFPVLFETDNENVSVNENGLITSHSAGTTTISIRKADDEKVFATLTVYVQEITITMTGDSTINTSSSKTYSVVIKNNGANVDNQNAIWSIDYMGYSSSVASLSNTVGNSVTFNAGSSAVTVRLIAKWQDDETILVSKNIIIESTGGGWW